MTDKAKDKLVSGTDWIFAGVLIAGALLLALFLWTSSKEGAYVTFRQNGEVVGTYPLVSSEDVEIGGTYTNVFRIEDGTVRIIETTCPNHQCEHTGTISAAGQSIVCVPNRVSAVIEGEGDEVDAVVG